MKRVRITITQELEVPEPCELVKGPDGVLLKLNQLYLAPHIEFTQSRTFSEKEMTFHELDEATMDKLYAALVREVKDIREG